jgi:hypothetical protein
MTLQMVLMLQVVMPMLKLAALALEVHNTNYEYHWLLMFTSGTKGIMNATL